jgi:hypothetical protein
MAAISGVQFSSTNDPAPKQDIPQGDNIDQDTWKLAEESVRSRNGGFSGVSAEGKYRQIKQAYDQITDNTQKAADWEGKDVSGM